jgi:pyruvate dehydrogenase E2 component (dihydrolipoamide acetyltransferase)
MANIVEMPKLGFDMAEGTLVNWLKAEGENIAKGEGLAEIETDKATVQVESAFTGVVYKHLVELNSHVPVGTPIAVISDPEEKKVDLDKIIGVPPKTRKAAPEILVEEAKPQPENPKEMAASTPQISGEFLKASPVAKAMAEKEGIDLDTIKGTGPEGRVVKRDILEKLNKTQKTTISEEIPSDQIVEISPLRSIIGKRMGVAKQTIPHFYVTHEYDASALLKMRGEINEGRSENERISVNDLINRAVGLTLRQFPSINSSLDKNQIVKHGHINIGNAVALDEGLLTVVCRDADQKPLSQISSEIKEMTVRVRSGKVLADDIEGSTFTISNLGMFEVESFIAIINPPEAAILAVSSAIEKPVVVNKQVVIGQQMKMTLSADHRLTDGVEAAKFMQALGLFIEQPWRLV